MLYIFIIVKGQTDDQTFSVVESDRKCRPSVEVLVGHGDGYFFQC